MERESLKLRSCGLKPAGWMCLFIMVDCGKGLECDKGKLESVASLNHKGASNVN